VKVEVTDDELRIPPEIAACLYRVAQEALRNVIKHAEVSEAMVQLSRKRGGVEMMIQDAGVGFDFLGTERGGLGLTSITERARQFDGRVAVQSRPGKGTRVITWLPLRKES
jgi:two-component system sensor histidine kinase UhpB